MMSGRHWIAAALALIVAACTVAGVLIFHKTPASLSGTAAGAGHGVSTPSAAPLAGPPLVYVHYYLWWTSGHWADKLGPAYPYGSAPIPGSTDGQGCNPTVSFSGSQIVDVPAEGLYDQSQAATFDRHIDLAANAGLKGFLADWQGTGADGQSPSSSGYNSRFDLMVTRVDNYDAAHGSSFGLGLAYAAFGDYQRSPAKIIADLKYFYSRYGTDPAFRNSYSSKPIVMWLDSRKFSAGTIRAVSEAVRPYVYLLGDETADSWASDGRYLDGTSYYWSTQNPWTNARAGSAVSQLADAVRLDGKRWFAPFIAGYDKQLLGGSCVERRGTQTLAQLWRLNGQTRPDGWFGISWNEFVENTYLEPSKRYGTMYLDALAALIKGT
jgi:hypothetical protein